MAKTKSWKSIKKGFKKTYAKQANANMSSFQKRAQARSNKKKDLYKRGKGKNF